jgi:hypothetical protein
LSKNGYTRFCHKQSHDLNRRYPFIKAWHFGCKIKDLHDWDENAEAE